MKITTPKVKADDGQRVTLLPNRVVHLGHNYAADIRRWRDLSDRAYVTRREVTRAFKHQYEDVESKAQGFNIRYGGNLVIGCCVFYGHAVNRIREWALA